MTERVEENPLSAEVKRHLRGVVRPILADDPRFGAAHGTSLEVVRHLITHGTIPGRMVPEIHFLPGDISVYPTAKLNVNHLIDLTPKDEQVNLREDTRMYARGIGRTHRFLTLLGIPLSNMDNNDLSNARDFLSVPDEDELGQPVARGYFIQKGFSPDLVDSAFNEADAIEACGFLLGISPEIQNTPGLSIVKGDKQIGDVTIRTFGKGLPYKYITGIEALGEAEKAFLANL